MEQEINEILSRSRRLLEPREVIRLSGELETILTAMASWGEIKTLGMARDKVVALGPNFQAAVSALDEILEDIKRLERES
jgi:hypothetical protein